MPSKENETKVEIKDVNLANLVAENKERIRQEEAEKAQELAKKIEQDQARVAAAKKQRDKERADKANKMSNRSNLKTNNDRIKQARENRFNEGRGLDFPAPAVVENVLEAVVPKVVVEKHQEDAPDVAFAKLVAAKYKAKAEDKDPSNKYEISPDSRLFERIKTVVKDHEFGASDTGIIARVNSAEPTSADREKAEAAEKMAEFLSRRTTHKASEEDGQAQGQRFKSVISSAFGFREDKKTPDDAPLTPDYLDNKGAYKNNFEIILKRTADPDFLKKEIEVDLGRESLAERREERNGVVDKKADALDREFLKEKIKAIPEVSDNDPSAIHNIVRGFVKSQPALKDGEERSVEATQKMCNNVALTLYGAGYEVGESTLQKRLAPFKDEIEAAGFKVNDLSAKIGESLADGKSLHQEWKNGGSKDLHNLKSREDFTIKSEDLVTKIISDIDKNNEEFNKQREDKNPKVKDVLVETPPVVENVVPEITSSVKKSGGEILVEEKDKVMEIMEAAVKNKDKIYDAIVVGENRATVFEQVVNAAKGSDETKQKAIVEVFESSESKDLAGKDTAFGIFAKIAQAAMADPAASSEDKTKFLGKLVGDFGHLSEAVDKPVNKDAEAIKMVRAYLNSSEDPKFKDVVADNFQNALQGVVKPVIEIPKVSVPPVKLPKPKIVVSSEVPIPAPIISTEEEEKKKKTQAVVSQDSASDTVVAGPAKEKGKLEGMNVKDSAILACAGAASLALVILLPGVGFLAAAALMSAAAMQVTPKNVSQATGKFTDENGNELSETEKILKDLKERSKTPATVANTPDTSRPSTPPLLEDEASRAIKETINTLRNNSTTSGGTSTGSKGVITDPSLPKATGEIVH